MKSVPRTGRAGGCCCVEPVWVSRCTTRSSARGTVAARYDSAGTTTEIHYQNHLEAVYCIEGKGAVELVDSGDRYEIEAGTVYALDQHDRHLLIAETQMRMVCVFNPPLVGPEVHDKNGVYPALSEA